MGLKDSAKPMATGLSDSDFEAKTSKLGWKVGRMSCSCGVTVRRQKSERNPCEGFEICSPKSGTRVVAMEMAPASSGSCLIMRANVGSALKRPHSSAS